MLENILRVSTMTYTLMILLTMIAAASLIFFWRRKKDLGIKVSLLLLILLTFLQSGYFYVKANNTLHVYDSNIQTDKTNNKQTILSPKEVIEVIKPQINEAERIFINDVSHSDVKYIQIDNDDDYEIVIHNKNLEKYNFILLDFIDGKFYDS